MLLTGGGTGGHITPLLAVAHKLKAQHSNIHIVYVGDRGSKFASMTEGQVIFDEQKQIFAGKLRRYNGESWLKRLTDVRTNLSNLRDMFLVVLGFFESLLLLTRQKPDVILLKGGFVGMPVGLAAALLRIPFVTHDSDALPGLANRVVARWARYHATGMPASFYTYPHESVRYVGVLVSDLYQPVDKLTQARYRKQLGIPSDAVMMLVTGGSNGAGVINTAIKGVLLSLKQTIPTLYVVHQTGQGKEYELPGTSEWLKIAPLLPLSELSANSGASDVIVTRAGANAVAEFGVQGKACIVVPNPMLTGGHQLINARELQKRHAVSVVQEDELADRLEGELVRLLTDSSAREKLGNMLRSITKPDAAEELAALLLTVPSQSQENSHDV